MDFSLECRIPNAQKKLLEMSFINQTSVQIPPKRRINVQPEVAATILENVKIGMIDATLFHDCVISQDFQNVS